MKVHALFLLSVLILVSCATGQKSAPLEDPKDFEAGEGPSDLFDYTGAEGESVSQEEAQSALPGEGSDESGENQVAEKEQLPPPRVGVWIDSVALDGFWALGYMQALEKAGVKIEKVVGTGFGCWIAASWALRGSGNQAEWQAFKWKDFESLGKGPQSLMSRITGKTVSEEKFRSDLKKWLVVEEFSSLKSAADCPVVDNRGGRQPEFQSASSLGLYKSLWLQMQTPFWGEELMPKEDAPYLSGLARWNVTSKDYDKFSGREGEGVDFWIHIKTAPGQLWARSQPWVYAAAAQQEWQQESWTRSDEGRWVYRVPLYKKKTVRQGELIDFTRRRRLLLEGRQMASDWMGTTWFRSNFSDSFSPN